MKRFVILLSIFFICQSSVVLAETTTEPDVTTPNTGSVKCDSYLKMVHACLKKDISSVWQSNLKADIDAIKKSLKLATVTAEAQCNYLIKYRAEDETISQCAWKE